MVNVEEGTGGDVNVVVSNSTSPKLPDAPFWGDAGRPGMPAIVFQGEFANAGATGDNLVNAISETISHEAGHKCGLGHNWDDRPTIMTSGEKVPLAVRQMGIRQFNNNDQTILQNRPKAQPAGEQRDTIGPTDLVTEIGELVGRPEHIPDDIHLNAAILVKTLPPGGEVGYISTAGEFIFQATESSQTYVSFLYDAGTDLAVRVNGGVHTLSDGSGTFALSNPNPFNPNRFLTADVFFATSAGPAAFVLDVVFDPTHTGGFLQSSSPVPAASPVGLLVLGLALCSVALVMIRRRARGGVALVS